MSIYVVALFISFIHVFLRAFQQKNVMNDKLWWVLPTSYGMGIMEYFKGGMIAVSYMEGGLWGAFWMINALSLGGGAGCLISILTHNRLSKLKDITVVNQS